MGHSEVCGNTLNECPLNVPVICAAWMVVVEHVVDVALYMWSRGLHAWKNHEQNAKRRPAPIPNRSWYRVGPSLRVLQGGEDRYPEGIRLPSPLGPQ